MLNAMSMPTDERLEDPPIFPGPAPVERDHLRPAKFRQDFFSSSAANLWKSLDRSTMHERFPPIFPGKVEMKYLQDFWVTSLTQQLNAAARGWQLQIQLPLGPYL